MIGSINFDVALLNQIPKLSYLKPCSNQASFSQKAMVANIQGSQVLLSYLTPVCIITNDKIKFLKHAIDSTTTSKHIYAFLYNNRHIFTEKNLDFKQLVQYKYGSRLGFYRHFLNTNNGIINWEELSSKV